MEIEFAMLADAASASTDNGKLNMLGADIRHIIGRFPLIVPSVSVVVKIKVPPEECDSDHRLEVVFTAPDGTVVPPRGEMFFNAQKPQTEGMNRSFLSLLLINGLSLPVTGTYLVRFLLDGEERKSIRLHCREQEDQEFVLTA